LQTYIQVGNIVIQEPDSVNIAIWLQLIIHSLWLSSYFSGGNITTSA